MSHPAEIVSGWFTGGLVAAWIIRREGQPSPWQARFRPPGGRTVSKSFKLEREAKTWLAERRAEFDAGDYVDSKVGAGTFEDYASGWMARRSVKPSSGERDASYLRSLIIPMFGGRTLNQITADEMETWGGAWSFDRAGEMTDNCRRPSLRAKKLIRW